MRIVIIAVILAFSIFLLPSCSNRKSTIDMKNVLEKAKQDDQRFKNADAAKKSIFPKMKDQ